MISFDIISMYTDILEDLEDMRSIKGRIIYRNEIIYRNTLAFLKDFLNAVSLLSVSQPTSNLTIDT